MAYWDDAEFIMITIIELFQNPENPLAANALQDFITIAPDFLPSAPEEMNLRILKKYKFAFVEHDVFDLSKIGSRSLPAAKLIFSEFPKWRSDIVAKLISRKSETLPTLAEELSSDVVLGESIGFEILNSSDRTGIIYSSLGRIRNRSKVLKAAMERHFDDEMSSRDLNTFVELEEILTRMDAASYKPTEPQEIILRKAKDSQPYDQLTESQRQLLEKFFGKRKRAGSKKIEISHEGN
jgi:hypothetical protein